MDEATITLTDSSGKTMSATTDASGAFSFSDLTPGTYRVSVRLKSGLQLTEKSLEIASTTGSQIQLNFDSTSQSSTAASVEVDARAPTLQTHSAEVSRSYNSATIRELPVLDRQSQELITLMPGITPPVVTSDPITDPQRTRSFNVNGQPSYVNLYNQDGTYANEPFNGRPLRVEPNEAVQALEVRTSNYNAQYGVSAGSWASTITRPGSNAIHGSLFEFNTNNYFRTGRQLTASPDTPRFSTNQFGGSAGGAILPDRMFWFVSYEGYLQRGREESVATVPANGFASGNFSQVPGAVIYNPFSGVLPGTVRSPFAGNAIPATQLNPTALSILSRLPAANEAGFSNNLVGSVPLINDNHRADGKIDHRFNERSTGFFRYGYTQGSLAQGSLLGALGAPLDSEFRSHNGVANYTQVFTTNLTGEFRVGYDRYRNQISPFGDFSSVNGFSSAFPNGVPSIAITGFSQIGLPANVPRKEIDNVYDGATNWLYRRGMHAVKFGVSARELQSNGFSNPYFSSLGSFVFGSGATLGTTGSAALLSTQALQANALAAFLLGAPTQAGTSQFSTTPAFRQRQYAAYASDTVNIYRKLYLELGVRYDVFMPIEAGQAGGNVTFDPTTNTTTALGLNGTSARAYRTDTNNVAPRVGLAFQPMRRLVFRGGYGIHYFAIPFALAGLNPAATGTQSGIAGGLTTTQFAIPSTATAAATSNLPYSVSSRTQSTPYVQTFSGMVQADMGNGFLLDAGYVGNVGRQLPYNLPLIGAPGTGLTALTPGRTALTTQTGAGLNSNYNSLQVNLTKKFGAGLALSGAYTYSKALDYGTNLLDPYNLRSNYGVADWDRTHVLSFSHLWRLPLGTGGRYMTTGWASRAFGSWQLNGILRWSTGTPYSVTADPLACACLGAGSVPANFNGSAGSTSAINGAGSFDTTLFSTPASGTFGTPNRNGFRGPEFFVYNAALFRSFVVRENIKMELRGEAYNVTNTFNPGNPVANLSSPGFGSTQGTIDGLAGRQFQVALRFVF